MPGPLSVLSLFSGCGGLDLGFVRAGFHVEAAFDNWGPAVDVYGLNHALLGTHEVYKKSLALSDGEIQLDDLPRCDVILGGPPCQGFSFAGNQFFDDPRNSLYQDFVEIVRALQPRAFVMENVRGMAAMALKDVTQAFASAGYTLNSTLAVATNFGVPQKRERLILVGFREDLDTTFQPPESVHGGLFRETPMVSVLEAIRDLPAPLTEDDPARESLSRSLQSHAHRPLTDTVQAFVRHIPNGGCFREAPRSTLPERLVKILDNPSRYRSPRLFPKPDPSEPAQTVPADTNPSIGGVLAPDLTYSDGPAVPVTAEDHTVDGVYTSPTPSRRFTAREAARLQSFPDEFIFEGSLTTQYRLIGNAVPVAMAEAFAERIAEQLATIENELTRV